LPVPSWSSTRTSKPALRGRPLNRAIMMRPASSSPRLANSCQATKTLPPRTAIDGCSSVTLPGRLSLTLRGGSNVCALSWLAASQIELPAPSSWCQTTYTCRPRAAMRGACWTTGVLSGPLARIADAKFGGSARAKSGALVVADVGTSTSGPTTLSR
jgi:hypothetical protein